MHANRNFVKKLAGSLRRSVERGLFKIGPTFLSCDGTYQESMTSGGRVTNPCVKHTTLNVAPLPPPPPPPL